MTTEKPTLLQHKTMGTLGIYWPETHTIEFHIGADTHEMHGDYLNEKWNEITQKEALENTQQDINDVRNDIENLKEKELTNEQADELEYLENKLDARENFLQVIREAVES